MSLVLTGYYGAETDADGRLTEEEKVECWQCGDKVLVTAMLALEDDSQRLFLVPAGTYLQLKSVSRIPSGHFLFACSSSEVRSWEGLQR